MHTSRLSGFSDEMLLDLIQNNDDRFAFTELYNRYWEILLDNAYQRLKSVEAAEEIVQEVFIDLFVRRAAVNPKTTVAAYLKTAVKYKVFNVYRSQQIHLQYLDNELHAQNLYAQSPEETFQKKELNLLLNEAANHMPTKCKEVFLMSKFDNLSNKAISDQLGISVSTVKKHITKAKSIVRDRFKHHAIDFLVLTMLLLNW